MHCGIICSIKKLWVFFFFPVKSPELKIRKQVSLIINLRKILEATVVKPDGVSVTKLACGVLAEMCGCLF